ncbi:hypothetical protein Hanom_Chr12g01138041 [Helianthus anomalus]
MLDSSFRMFVLGFSSLGYNCNEVEDMFLVLFACVYHIACVVLNITCFVFNISQVF